MKRLWLALILIMTLVVVGCSNESKESSSQIKTNEKEAMKTKEKDNSAPLVNEKNSLDERIMLEEAMNRQRDILKLSFITEEYRSGVGIGYHPLDDEFHYEAIFTYPHIISNILFNSGTTYISSNDYIDTSNGEKLEHDSFDAIYGAYQFESDETYYITGEDKNGVSYIVTAGDSNEGYTNEIMELMGNSMKTEEEGAYDPFYHLFSIDATKLKFPSINKSRSDIYAVTLSARDGNISSSVSVTYLTGDQDQITYTILEKESLWVNDDWYEQVNEDQTVDGHHIIEYTDGSEEDRYFYWFDDVYHYEMMLTSYNDNTITTEDIYAIIDSAMKDDRALEKKDIFKAINEKPVFTENEEELNRHIEKLEDKY